MRFVGCDGVGFQSWPHVSAENPRFAIWRAIPAVLFVVSQAKVEQEVPHVVLSDVDVCTELAVDELSAESECSIVMAPRSCDVEVQMLCSTGTLAMCPLDVTADTFENMVLLPCLVDAAVLHDPPPLASCDPADTLSVSEEVELPLDVLDDV